jgi:ABC-2 type transport system ATP-binding protein
MHTNEVAISAKNLTRRFGKFTAVNAISIDVNRGEVFGFLGANGAGKTTAIRMFCGLLKPTSGEAFVGGLSVKEHPRKIKQRIGYMSQKFSLYEELRVEENIDFFAGAYGLPAEESEHSKEKLLGRFQLGEVRRRVTKSLPLGWKQRLALGCAMLHRPEILFLDEPTGGVDPLTRRDFWRMIHQLAAEGTTVFVTTHYIDEAEYCERISIMNHGEIITLGAPSELKKQYGKNTIQDVFVHLIKS